MQITAFVIVLVMVIIGLTYKHYYENKKRLFQLVRKSYGTKPQGKVNDFNRISIYWKETSDLISEEEKIDEITWNDLDMDLVFARINSCMTFVGEQVLYSLLHALPVAKTHMDALEEQISFFQKHDQEREDTQIKLMKLGSHKSAYIVPQYISKLDFYRIKGIWKYRLMQGLLFLSILPPILLRDPRWLLLGLSILFINLLIYLKGKSKYEADLETLSYIIGVIKTSYSLSKGRAPSNILGLEEMAHNFGRISNAVDLLYSKKQSAIYGDFFGVIQDYFIGVTLWDFIKYDQIISKLESKKSVFMSLYERLGRIDAAISIASYRESLRYYCTPYFTETKEIDMREIYHPLIDEPVSNSLNLNQNALITGSNASGKSTFIKALALNLVLGQNIHTCTAQSFKMPFTKVVTSMAVRDDLMMGESYFMKEIKYLNRIVTSLSKKRFLVCVIDEILKGTNTEERIAASTAIMEFLSESNCIAVVASHDIELTRLLRKDYLNYHFKETWIDKDVQFDFKIYEGAAVSKNALNLLEIVGFPEVIVSRARQLILDYQ